jgi:phosphopantetheinyl transferase (holo-ACP synthase)
MCKKNQKGHRAFATRFFASKRNTFPQKELKQLAQSLAQNQSKNENKSKALCQGLVPLYISYLKCNE